MKIKTIVLLGLSFFLTSCLDEVKLNTRAEINKLVVEGVLTNSVKNQFLRLSLTTKLGNLNNLEPVKGAFVEVQTAENLKIEYRPVPNELGIYKPADPNFVGKIGSSYSLYIKLANGRVYKSALQKLPQPVEIEALNAVFNEVDRFGFQVNLNFKDPKDQPNYYRWTGLGFHQRISVGVPIGFGAFCCNRCWVMNEDKSVNIFQDNLSNGNTINNIPVYFSPFYVLGKHLIEISQFTMSAQTYQYWRRYKEQSTREGTIFDPLPAPLLGNIVNINDPSDVALGYFEVSGVSKKRIEPFDDKHGLIAFNLNNSFFVPDGDCMKAFPYSVYIGANPPGW